MYLNRFFLQLFLPVLLVISACSSREDQPEIDTEAELSLEETLVIESGDGESADRPLIAFAGYVTADREGNIYVHDGHDGRKSILKFDRNGNHLQTFSGSGSGPGEHLALTAMFADSRGRLITADRENARLTVFSEEGEVLHQAPSPNILHVRQIRGQSDGGYILSGWNAERESLVHLVDSELRSIESSLVSMNDFPGYFENEVQKQWISGNAGMVLETDPEQIAFIPFYYDGTLYRYRRSGGGNWSLADSVTGYRNIEPPVSFTANMESVDTDRVSGISMSGGQMTVIRNESRTYGLFRLNDGSYIHLSFAYSDEKTDLVVERFSPDMELLQHTVTDTLDLGFTHRKQPFWVDRIGEIYLTDNSDIPTVRRFRLKGLGLDSR